MSEKIKGELTRNKQILFIILFVITLIFKMVNLELSFGIEINISLMGTILIMLCFGIKKAIISEVIISVVCIVFFKGAIIEATDIIQLIFLWLVCLKKYRLNIIMGDILFWIIFSLPFTVMMRVISDSKEIAQYFQFSILFLVVSGMLNAFLAEVIYVYIIKTKVFKRKMEVKYKDIIVHILALAIIVPFIINIFIDLGNSYTNICANVENLSNEIYYYIEDELDTWSEKSITNLKLSGIIEKGILEESIKKSTRYKPFNIKVVGKNEANILDLRNANNEEEQIKLGYKNKELSENLSKIIPIKDNKGMLDNSWVDSYFLYKRILKGTGLEVRIEVPTRIYNERIIKEHISRFRLLFAITLIIAVIAMLLNKVIFNNLYKISMVAKGLSEKIEKNIVIDWPENTIVEIGFLGKNIKEMSNSLRENFIKLNRTRERLYELAYYDVLTGLPNRSYFKKYLDEVITESENVRICVMFVDLNKFKLINDTWGHHIGDKLLTEVANRFKKLKNEKCKIFRLGGDEFVFVIKSRQHKEIEKTGKGIINSFKEDFKIDDLVLNSNCSVGASIYPDDSVDIDTIIKYADIAMYTSKENGGDYLQLFNKEINEKLLEKISIEEGINFALEKDEFVLYYQPKYSGKNSELKSLEALIRWEKEDGTIVPPNKFIPIAEESDLILEIDKWVIYEACKKNKLLQDEGYKKIPISVNVSAKHFANREILDILKDALNKSKLEPKYLTVEITEGVLIKNVDMVSQMIIELKNMGVHVSIDDFGKGYSSINQLMALPINEVKIDRDFIMNIHNNKKKRIVVKLIVEIAHGLDLNVVAEGIELEEERKYLESINCDELQGYLFSKPINLEDLKKKIRG